MFWKLLLGTVAMLAFGYGGEMHQLGPSGAWVGFALGLSGWFFILAVIFQQNLGQVNEFVQSSYNTMRIIVTLGWSIYPLGYLFGYLLGAVDEVFLNVIYNVADFVNKIAFVLSCWSCAKDDSKGALLA